MVIGNLYGTSILFYAFSFHLPMPHLMLGHIPYYVLHYGYGRMEEVETLFRRRYNLHL